MKAAARYSPPSLEHRICSSKFGGLTFCRSLQHFYIATQCRQRVTLYLLRQFPPYFLNHLRASFTAPHSLLQ